MIRQPASSCPSIAAEVRFSDLQLAIDNTRKGSIVVVIVSVRQEPWRQARVDGEVAGKSE